MLSSEVLPAPFGPMIEAMCPRRTESDTPSTARTPPNRFDASVTTSCTPSGAADLVAAAIAIRFVFLPFERDMRPGYGGHDAEGVPRTQPIVKFRGIRPRLAVAGIIVEPSAPCEPCPPTTPPCRRRC